MNNKVKSEEYRKRDKRHHPADQEHYGHAHEEAQQGHPHVVILEDKQSNQYCKCIRYVEDT